LALSSVKLTNVPVTAEPCQVAFEVLLNWMPFIVRVNGPVLGTLDSGLNPVMTGRGFATLYPVPIEVPSGFTTWTETEAVTRSSAFGIRAFI
jgi:hypothetical protein